MSATFKLSIFIIGFFCAVITVYKSVFIIIFFRGDMLNSFLIIIKNNNRVRKNKKTVDFEPLTVQISTVFSYVKRGTEKMPS